MCSKLGLVKENTFFDRYKIVWNSLFWSFVLSTKNGSHFCSFTAPENDVFWFFFAGDVQFYVEFSCNDKRITGFSATSSGKNFTQIFNNVSENQPHDKVETLFFSIVLYYQGGYSQNFLIQILKIFVTLGLIILKFYRPKVFFKANISKVWCFLLWE